MRFAVEIFSRTGEVQKIRAVRLDLVKESGSAEGGQSVGKPSKKGSARRRCIAG